MYVLENSNFDLIRAWQGHKIGQRWFSAVHGSFKVQLIAVDNWHKPSLTLHKIAFTLY
jgi:hypothetical protein